MRAKIIGLAIGLMVVVGTQAVSQDGTPVSRTNSSTDELQPNKSDADKVPKVTDERPMSFWMEKKLDFSKSILEALTKGDFDTLAKDAEQMRLLGRIEGFVRRKNDDYRIQLRTFDFATLELGRQASRKNAEGAALAFNQLTNSCVACHVLLREGVE